MAQHPGPARPDDPDRPEPGGETGPEPGSELARDIASAEDPWRPIRRFLAGIRRRIERRPVLRRVYRIAVAVLGAGIALVGIPLIPLPGPGWLVVFLGLAVLGTEFSWARRLAAFAKRQLAPRFWAWWRARSRRADPA